MMYEHLQRQIDELARLLDDLKTRDDPYSGPYLDHGGASTVIGWSTFTRKEIYCKTSGKLVFVVFDIRGTSNSISATFTLPYASVTSLPTIAAYVTGRVMNNGVYQAGDWFLGSGSDTVTARVGFSGGAFTASGSKEVTGEFFYFRA